MKTRSFEENLQDLVKRHSMDEEEELDQAQSKLDSLRAMILEAGQESAQAWFKALEAIIRGPERRKIKEMMVACLLDRAYLQ